jgi:RimJ/RimL family protein N-acetyltransferase
MQLAVRLQPYLWRPLTDSAADTDFVLTLRNSAAAQQAFFTPRISREEHVRFVAAPERHEEINWIIEKSCGERVGMSGIYRVDPRNQRAETGRVIVLIPELYPLNLFVSAYVVFDHLGLNKLIGDALSSNTVVNGALERLGAVREAVLREHMLKDGVLQDVFLYGMLARDWQKHKPCLIAEVGEPQILRHFQDEL